MTPFLVYVSSTFEDMSLERDYLARELFPRLRNSLRADGIQLVVIDLNFGIPDGSILTHGSELEIMHSHINRSTVFLALIGERFGRIPEGSYDSIETQAIYRAISQHSTDVFVYKRSCSLTSHHFEKTKDSRFYESSQVLTEELTKLEKRLLSIDVSIRQYDSLEFLGTLIVSDLTSVLETRAFRNLGSVFLSYSRVDIESAERIKSGLEGAGYVVWLDLKGIALGEEWPDAISSAIGDCDAVLFLVSPSSISSQYCSKELVFAHRYEF